MPFATIAGLTLDFVSFAELEPLHAGEHARSFNNSALSSKRNVKRGWTGTTRPYTYTEVSTVMGHVLADNVVACTGDAFQGATTAGQAAGTVLCQIRGTSIPYERAERRTSDRQLNALKYEVSLTLELREV